jgi:hypothetical protein
MYATSDRMYLRIFWRVSMNLHKNPAFCRKIWAFSRKIRYEYLLGPAGSAYSLSGLVAATDGSLKKNGFNGSMGAAYVSIGGLLPPRSVSVFGQPSSIWPELTGIAMVLKDCLD